MQVFEAKINELQEHPQFIPIVHQMASALHAGQAIAPRLASLFSTQQRWLMSHLAVALYFRNLQTGKAGVLRRDFVEAVSGHGLASRNTATAFFDEAAYYGIIEPPAAPVAQKNVAEPAASSLSALIGWYHIHLSALDAMDGGTRVAHLQEAGLTLLARIHVAVAEGLLSSRTIRSPAPIYAAFASVDEGGSLMDRLVAGVNIASGLDQDRYVTSITSVSVLAHSLNLSRTHAGRTLAAAAATNDALGWSGTRGRSPLWVSRDFIKEYAQVQAAKLAIIEAAYLAAGSLAEV